MRILLFRWGLAAVYVALVFGLLLFFPVWTWAPLLVGWAAYLAWSYLSQERFFSQSHKVRPLTPWDVPDYAAFRERYRIACAELGLTREPYLVVLRSGSPLWGGCSTWGWRQRRRRRPSQRPSTWSGMRSGLEMAEMRTSFYGLVLFYVWNNLKLKGIW